MDLSDVSEIAKVATVAKNAFEYLKTKLRTKDDVLRLVELQDAFQTLREENAQLREELRRRIARAEYRRKRIYGAVVLVRQEPDGTDGPPCCPKCQDSTGEPLPLQAAPTHSTLNPHRCIACKGIFPFSTAALKRPSKKPSPDE